MSIKDYIRFKVWKLIHQDFQSFSYVWLRKYSYLDITIGIVIFSVIMFSFTKRLYYLWVGLGAIFISITISTYLDYKNREWFRWKINRLKKGEKT